MNSDTSSISQSTVRSSTRVRGIFAASLEIGLLLLAVGSASILSSVIGMERAIKFAFILSLGGLSLTCIGGAKAITGRSWLQNPAWLRIVFIVIAVPSILLGPFYLAYACSNLFSKSQAAAISDSDQVSGK